MRRWGATHLARGEIGGRNWGANAGDEIDRFRISGASSLGSTDDGKRLDALDVTCIELSRVLLNREGVQREGGHGIALRSPPKLGQKADGRIHFFIFFEVFISYACLNDLLDQTRQKNNEKSTKNRRKVDQQKQSPKSMKK